MNLPKHTTDKETGISYTLHGDYYDNADFEKKKMIVNCLIRRVDVFSDYKLKIDFNFDFQQFINGIDCIA